MSVVNYVRPMTVRERFRAALTLYRSHFWKFFQIYLGSTIVVLIAWGIDYHIRFVLKFDYSLVVFISLTTVPISLFLGMAAVVATSNAVLRRPVKVRAAYRRAFNRRAVECISTTVIPTLAWSVYGQYLIDTSSIFYILYFLLSIVFYLVYPFLIVFVPAVSILERRDAVDTVKRAFTLSKNNFGQVLINYGVGFFLPIVIIVSLIGCLGIFFLLLYSTTNTNEIVPYSLGQYYIFMAIFEFFFTLFFLPAGNLIVLLLYYDIRARRENYGEDLLAEEMGYQPMVETMKI